ncbi:MAG: hypothetical protein SGPRY_007295, partial [Prymnesium sp.]
TCNVTVVTAMVVCWITLRGARGGKVQAPLQAPHFRSAPAGGDDFDDFRRIIPMKFAILEPIDGLSDCLSDPLLQESIRDHPMHLFDPFLFDLFEDFHVLSVDHRGLPEDVSQIQLTYPTILLHPFFNCIIEGREDDDFFRLIDWHYLHAPLSAVRIHANPYGSPVQAYARQYYSSKWIRSTIISVQKALIFCTELANEALCI